MITNEMIEAACEAMAIKVAKQDGVELSKAGYRHGAESRPDEHEQMREYVRDALAAALALIPGEPVAWEVAEMLPSGSRRWQVVEHENHARMLAERLKADVRPLFAAPAPLPVAVKELEWGADNCAETPFGSYTINDYGADDDKSEWQWTFHCYPYGDPDETKHSTENAAKAAAQADYEARIRSALSSPAQTGYCSDCESQTTITNGRCSCGSGRVVSTPASDIAGLREALERIAEASPRSTNSWSAEEAFSWCAAIAETALDSSALQHVAKGERG